MPVTPKLIIPLVLTLAACENNKQDGIGGTDSGADARSMFGATYSRVVQAVSATTATRTAARALNLALSIVVT